MDIKELKEKLEQLNISHEYKENQTDVSKSKIVFADSKYERQIAVSSKTGELDIFVFISKGRKKSWDNKQTKEQNSECAREKNRFVRDVFNKFDMDFKLPEWKPQTTTQKFEGSESWKEEDDEVDFTGFDPVDPMQDISDQAAIYHITKGD